MTSHISKLINTSDQLLFLVKQIETLQGYFTHDGACLPTIPQINYRVTEDALREVIKSGNAYLCSREDYCNESIKDQLGSIGCTMLQLTFHQNPLCHAEYTLAKSVPHISILETTKDEQLNAGPMFCFYSNENIDLPLSGESNQPHQDL